MLDNVELPAEFADALAAERAAYRLPPRLPDVAERVIHSSLALLFPHYTGETGCRAGTVTEDARSLAGLLHEALALPGMDDAARRHAVDTFFKALPDVRDALLLDAAATAEGDPAASGVDEVILAYPGFFATAVHRMARPLHVAGVPLLPRVLGELAHRATGIDIHPGAQLGASFAIDHGTGVLFSSKPSQPTLTTVGSLLSTLRLRRNLAASHRHASAAGMGSMRWRGGRGTPPARCASAWSSLAPRRLR